MKTTFKFRELAPRKGALLLASLFAIVPSIAGATQAYGSLSNFDCVNDTEHECHGFEIEVDDCHSTDITYTYDYNHYGIPGISEDNGILNHPKTFIRYVSGKNPDGSWKAYTAIPSGPILPTQGHQFTDPSVNFGGEHFGVGLIGAHSGVKYHWLYDDGSGNLTYGPDVYISTPTFTYVPPAGGVAGNVVAHIEVPEPAEPPVMEFGVANWVKEIRTVSHNANKVRLEDLRGEDPGQLQPWANGEVSEVESEWNLMQTEFAAGKGGVHGELDGAPEGRPNDNEIVTRRYEFYKYLGPVDAETGEAVCDQVGKDGIHGRGQVTYSDYFDPILDEWHQKTVNCAKIVVVGDFYGTQMAGFDAAPKLDLIAHIMDGNAYEVFARRRLVIAGPDAFTASVSAGTLPTGLRLAATTGILAGVPTVPGDFTFTINVTDAGGSSATRIYNMHVNGDLAVNTITASVLSGGGTTSGSGTFPFGSVRSVKAKAKAGYQFWDWTENGVQLSTSPNYAFTVDADHTFVASFRFICQITTGANPAEGGTTAGDTTVLSGDSVTVSATPNAGFAFTNWLIGTKSVSNSSSYTFSATKPVNLTAHFAHLYTVSLTASPAIGGTVSGGGTFADGRSINVKATARPGYLFSGWTEGGVTVSTDLKYHLVVNSNHSLVAVFTKI
ncbi:hypothetical protein BH11ARM1_BH11ARM1_02700 [soil metagenome]